MTPGRGGGEMEAGWYPDPTGRNDQRYWDGSQWTEHATRGDRQGRDAIAGDYAPPRTPPPGGSARPRRRVWPWALLVLFAVGIAGCGLVVLVVDSAVDEINAAQRRHAITREQFEALILGTHKSAVIEELGKGPEDAQEFVSEGVVDEEDIRSSCIYYNVVGGEFGDRFQLCFDTNDLLDAKNAYA